MSDRERLLTAIEAEPTDDLLWLVFADWLEENGDPTASEVRMTVEDGEWGRLRKDLLRMLALRRARRVGWECLSRVLPMYEALCPLDTESRPFIELMLQSDRAEDIEAVWPAFQEAAQARARVYQLDPYRYSLASDFIILVLNACAFVDETCAQCSSLVAQAALGQDGRMELFSSRGRSFQNVEIRWQVARCFRYRFEEETGRP